MMTLTYQNLLEEQTNRVLIESLSSQTVANRATALRGFLRANHLELEDVVGDEMRWRYPESLERYVNSMQDAGYSKRHVSSGRSLIHHWKKLVIEKDAIAALDAGTETPFQQALKTAMTGFSVTAVAKRAAVPTSMLFGWLQGKTPRRSNARYILRLESYLGLERNSLVVLSGMKVAGYKPTVGGDPTPVPYNEKILGLTSEAYFHRPAEDSSLRKQWHGFLKYKTAAVPPLRRSNKGKWRFSPCPITPNTPTYWWSFLDGREVASARYAWTCTARFLGWLAMPANRGGAGLAKEALDTLAWFAVPDFIEPHLEWQRKRVGGLNKGAIQFLAFVASLMRPEVGYLRQRPDLHATLPVSYQQEPWDSLCQRQFELVQQLEQVFKTEVVAFRDSFRPINHILQLEQPMDAMADMLQRMRAARPIGQPGREATWGRDMVLIRLLLSNPLRLRMLAHLTWSDDNMGELHKRADGSWWIKISRLKFKNTAGAAGDMDYESQVHPSAWRSIEQYLFCYRPRLLRAPTDLVFLTQNTHGRKGHRPWGDASVRVKQLTEQYLARCAGIRAHAFRHIVATSILKADGGDLKTAALVLNDRPGTVEKHYAWLRSNDGSKRMAELLEGPFSRM